MDKKDAILTLRIGQELKEFLHTEAEEEGRSTSDYARRQLEELMFQKKLKAHYCRKALVDALLYDVEMNNDVRSAMEEVSMRAVAPSPYPPRA